MRTVLVFTALVCLVMASSALAGDPDLVFYFSYDNPIEGDTITDESDNGFKGTVKNKADQVDGGKRGKAMEFESGSYIDLDGASIPEELLPREEMTLCAWVKCVNTGGDHAIFNAQAGDGTWVIHPEIKGGGNFRWLLRADGAATIFDLRTGAVDWDEWLHYAGVYDGKTGTLFINGENVGEQPGSGDIAKDWAAGARVGYNIDNARPFTGIMDDVCMWKRALTPEEIALVMADGPGGIFDDAVSPVGNMTTTWGKLKVSI